jgi:hypothetical protein
VSDWLLAIANGILEGARPRVVDVVAMLGDGTLVSGYPTKVSVGGSSALVLTAQGALAGMGHDAPVDPEAVVWVWITSDDGTEGTFGTPNDEIASVLGEALAEAKQTEPRGADAARLEIALAAVAHAKGNAREADRRYRGAMSKLTVLDLEPRALGDLWMRLAAVYTDLRDVQSLRMAAEQAITNYTAAFGADHPRVMHARGVLERAALVAL